MISILLVILFQQKGWSQLGLLLEKHVLWIAWTGGHSTPAAWGNAGGIDALDVVGTLGDANKRRAAPETSPVTATATEPMSVLTDRPRAMLCSGALLLAFTALVSLWVTPDLESSLPWAILMFAGTGLVIAASTAPGWRLSRYLTPTHLTWVFLALGYIALAVVGLATQWPSHKLSWLSGVYGSLPSLRSLNVSWLAQGLPANHTGSILATYTGFAIAVTLTRPAPTSASLVPSTRKRGRNRLRLAAGPLAILGTVVVFMTGSRASLAGVVITILLVLAVRDRRWLCLPGGFAAGLGVATLVQTRAPSWVLGFFLREETLDIKLVARVDIWASALRGIQDHVFTGIGLGVFNQIMPVRYPYESVGLSFDVSHAHNIFLDAALSIGVFGLLGLILLLIAMIYLGGSEIRRNEDTKVVSLGLVASTTVFIVYGLTDAMRFSIPTSFTLWLWASALAIVSYNRNAVIAPEDRTASV